jgi:RHS repeat-associated protein
VVSEREYDYGSGSAGPIVRRTNTSYLALANSNYLGQNLLDVPSSIAILDGAGVQKGFTTYGYDEYPLVASGVTTQLNPNPANGSYRGNLTSVRRWLNTTGTYLTTTNKYYDTGMLERATDPGNHTTTFEYGAAFAGAYLTRTTNHLTHSATSNFDFNTGLVTSTTDPNGRTTTFSYDFMSRPDIITRPDGGFTDFNYTDSSPFKVIVTRKIDATKNYVAEAEVDALGRLKKTRLLSDPQGTVFADTVYDAAGRVSKVSNPYRSGDTVHWTETQYDALGRVTKVIPPDGTASSNHILTQYAGNTTTVTDQAGNQRRSYMDGLGRLIRVDEPGNGEAAPLPGSPSTGSVTITGEEQSVGGGEWVYECALWDMEGYCLEWEWVWHETTVWDSGMVSIAVNGLTKSVSYGQTSTAASIATALRNAINADSSYPVSASVNGNVVSLTAKATGTGTNYTLSATSWTNDPTHFDNPSFVPAASGSTLTGGMDSSGGSSGSGPRTLATPAVTLYAYDALDNLTCVVQKGADPNAFSGCSFAPAVWRPRSFTHDSLSRLTQASNPESGTISYTYDNDGNLLTKVAPAPNQTGLATVTTTFTYDALHRLTQKSYSDATPLVKYAYDGTAPVGCSPTLTITNGIGRRTAMCDGAGWEAWSYDSLGRVLTDRRNTNGVTRDFAYGYNVGSGVTSIGYPTGRTITYSYNASAQSISAVDVASGINYATGALYTAAGGLSVLTNGASLVSTYFYNNRLQPCRISVRFSGNVPANCGDTGNIGNVLDFSYGFNLGTANNGNVASLANNRTPNRSQTFTYDELSRIKTAQTQATTGQHCWGETFGYDIWANLLTIGGLTGYTGCTQENLNIGVTTKNQISGYTYDAAGNMTTNPGVGTYTYDAENRMTATAGVTYTYDGDGKRVKKSNGKLYWYGIGSDAMLETDAAGNTPMEFIFFGGKRIARRDSGGAVSYFFADHLGTSRVVTNATGGAPEESDYYPFGDERVVTDALPDQNYKFTGKERDTESGLDFFIARHYASNLGRFLQPDEFTGGPVDAFSSSDPLPPGPLPYADITNPQSLNKYTYTWNNPQRYTDANGHEPDDLITRISEFLRDPDVTHGVGAGGARFLARTLNGFGSLLEPQGKFIPVPMMPTFNDKQETIATVTETVLTVLSLASATPARSSPAAVTLNRAAGLKFEGQVLKSEGLPKNTKPITALDPKTGKTGTTIPDAIRPNGQTVDMKAGKIVSDSPQLRRQSQISAQSGRKGQVIVSSNNQKVSPTVQARMDVKKAP